MLQSIAIYTLKYKNCKSFEEKKSLWKELNIDIRQANASGIEIDQNIQKLLQTIDDDIEGKLTKNEVINDQVVTIKKNKTKHSLATIHAFSEEIRDGSYEEDFKKSKHSYEDLIKQVGFLKLYNPLLKELISNPVFDPETRILFYILSKTLAYQHIDSEDKPIKSVNMKCKNDISKETNMSKMQIFRMMDKLIQKKIICEDIHKSGYYKLQYTPDLWGK